ncbi:MAG TPA: hypothetical protein V6D47_07910 [Oscillatoriaceae cyanobacterium]
MRIVNILLDILLAFLMPSPKNLKKIFALLNELFASGKEQPKLSQNQWDELRRYRDAKKTK